MSHETIRKVTEPYRNLANGVLIQTLKDCIAMAEGSLSYLRLNEKHELELRAWLVSTENHPGSFLFWATMTGLSKEALTLFKEACFEILDTGTIPDIVFDWTDPRGHFLRLPGRERDTIKLDKKRKNCYPN